VSDDDNEKISLTEAVLYDASFEISHAAFGIMDGAGKRLDMHVIEGTPSLDCKEVGEAIEVTMILRFTLPKGQKRSDTDA
jgi:hypothetical protein